MLRELGLMDQNQDKVARNTLMVLECFVIIVITFKNNCFYFYKEIIEVPMKLTISGNCW